MYELNEDAIRETQLDNLVKRLRKDQSDMEDAIKRGDMLSLNRAGELLGTSRQNFSDAIRSGALEIVPWGDRIFVTKKMLRDWRGSLAFQRKGHSFADANSEEINVSG